MLRDIQPRRWPILPTVIVPEVIDFGTVEARIADLLASKNPVGDWAAWIDAAPTPVDRAARKSHAFGFMYGAHSPKEERMSVQGNGTPVKKVFVGVAKSASSAATLFVAAVDRKAALDALVDKAIATDAGCVIPSTVRLASRDELMKLALEIVSK